MADDEKKGKTLKDCARFDAAYGTMKASPNQANYVAMLEALAADLRDGACGYMPLETQADVEALQKTGKMKWPALQTSRGKMLTLFSSIAQASKKNPAAGINIQLGAFFKVLEDNADIAGFVVNPFDDQRGFLIERKNLEVVLARAKGPKEIQIIDAACRALRDRVAGVPEGEFQKELASLGGLRFILEPLQRKWLSASDADVTALARDAVTRAFVAGALVTRGADMVRNADADECVDRVPELKEEIARNADEYVKLLREKLSEEDLANNIGFVAQGAAAFGFGWGLAKGRESEGGK